MNGVIEQLTELRLHGMAGAAKDLLAQKTPVSFPEALRQLIQSERSEREARSIMNRMKTARFPHHKDFASFDYTPLVGAALPAMHACPEGFPFYYDRSTLVSANLMKAFRQRKLLPTADHVLYSFRHSFEDRMLEAGLDYGLRCALMGHKNTRPEYGIGGSLDYRRSELLKVAHPFKPDLFADLAE